MGVHGAEKATGLYAQYGATINMDAAATVEVDGDVAYGVTNQTWAGSYGTINVNNDISVTAKGGSQAYGITSFISSNATEVSSVTDHDGIFVKGNAIVNQG